MKKLLFSIVLVLLIAVPAFALGDIDIDVHNNPSASATGGNAMALGGSVFGSGNSTNHILNVDTNIFNPHNTNTQRQSQGQNQGQIQGQGQDQFGYVSIESPTPLLSPPSQSIPELNFGNGRLDWNFAKSLPKVGIPLYNPNETVVKVIDTTANVKAKNLLPELLDMIADQTPLSISDRLIIIKAEAQKSWNTGGNAGGAGSYLPTSGLAGASGAGSIVPSWGGTKADDLYTIIIVRVAL